MAATPPRTAATPENPLEAIKHTLIKQMRLRFQDSVTVDPSAQAMIAEEVDNFLGNGAPIRDLELAKLEDRIRGRLLGEPAVKNAAAAAKKARDGTDEWGKIYEFDIKAGAFKDSAKAEVRKKQMQELRASLDAHVRAKEDKAKAEKAEDMEYAAKEQAALRKWQDEEEAKKRLRQEVAAKLQREREMQLLERRTKTTLALEKQAREDAAMAAKLAYQAKLEFEAEERHKLEAKAALQTYLQGNEANKAIREAERAKQFEEDAAYCRLYAEKLDKQERERNAQVEKIKVYQAAQEERIAKQMASHPGTFSTKRWISTALADKYLQDREDKREAEEQRRAAARRAVNQRLVADVTVQLAEKERRKEEEKEREKAYAQRVYSDLRKWEDEQRARKEKEVEKKMRVRAELEAQMRANANKNVKVAMSTTERQLNTKILAAVDELNTSGKVDPLMLNTGVLPK